MANPKSKHKSNAQGPWYCTSADDPKGEGCIGCNVCYNDAADFFKSDADGNAFVKCQPATDAEIEVCQEQASACPVGAIGSDG